MSAYDSELLSPPVTHGRIRRTCEELWGLIGVLWGFSIVAAFMWANWFAWTLAVVLAVGFVWTVAVSWAPENDTDREAFKYAALTTVALVILAALAVVLGVALGGGK